MTVTPAVPGVKAVSGKKGLGRMQLSLQGKKVADSCTLHLKNKSNKTVKNYLKSKILYNTELLITLNDLIR